jgi:hemoglobin-like flavoprotein
VAEPRDSYGRCLGRGDFIGRFYEIFLASDPSVPPLFAKTDFAKQKALLRHMLMTMILFDGEDELAARSLQRMGTLHGTEGLDVSKHLYELWTASLLRAVREHDPKCDAGVVAAWTAVCRRAIDFMLGAQAAG